MKKLNKLLTDLISLIKWTNIPKYCEVLKGAPIYKTEGSNLLDLCIWIQVVVSLSILAWSMKPNFLLRCIIFVGMGHSFWYNGSYRDGSHVCNTGTLGCKDSWSSEWQWPEATCLPETICEKIIDGAQVYLTMTNEHNFFSLVIPRILFLNIVFGNILLW